MESIPNQSNRVEEMFKLFWQGGDVFEIMKDASESEIGEFAKMVMEDENKQYGVSLISSLIEKVRKEDKSV